MRTMAITATPHPIRKAPMPAGCRDGRPVAEWPSALSLHAAGVATWRRWQLLGAWLLIFLSLSGAASAQGKPAGMLTWALHFSLAPTYFDPAETAGIITPFKFLYALHDALLKPMPQGLLTPSLAETWTESPDGLVYEFKLRQGVTFHNGDPLTAADVAFSFQRYKGAGAKLYKDKVQAVDIVDPHRVRFRLHEPWSDFLIFLGTPATGAGWVVPKKYVEQVGDEGFKRHPIGAGPYRFVSHTPGIDLVVEAFEGYWRKVPRVKRLVFKSVPEPTTRMAMLKKGEADIGYTLPAPLAEEARRDPKLTLKVTQGAATFWLDFTGKWDPASPWHDRRVRLAANYAIDREAINEAETGYPDLDDLFKQQAREREPTPREAMLHELQRLVQERAMFAPIFELVGLHVVGPRVEDSGLGLIALYPWSGPYEDVQLKP